MAMTNTDFAVFILTHGRPRKVVTYDTLKRQGYTGDIYIIIDNEDKTADEYRKIYGDKVIVFDKAAIAKTFDEGDNFNDRRAVIYARNACFEIAKDLSVTYFLQLDDDYKEFRYRFNHKNEYITGHEQVRNLDKHFDMMLDYFKSIDAKAIAYMQGGDFIGGYASDKSKSIQTRRKCMNSFFCSTERPFQFVGRINEDVNTYVWYQSLGNLFLSFNSVLIEQMTTQDNPGGMTEMYLDSGTYIKSFYTIMYAPSSTRIKLMNSNHPRLHHEIAWLDAIPRIVSEQHRKAA